jgi:uncharacterized membrane protein (UPF0127 family)
MLTLFPISSFKPSIGKLGGLLGWLMLLTGSVVGACPLLLPTTSITVKGAHLTLEIAATPEARKCGLSSRSELPPDNGMLFVLPESMPFAVWMKDTRLPLSVAFLDAAGRILTIEQMDPLRTDVIYESLQPVRYAIEVNKGWFNEHAIRVGDVIGLSLPAGINAR